MLLISFCFVIKQKSKVELGLKYLNLPKLHKNFSDKFIVVSTYRTIKMLSHCYGTEYLIIHKSMLLQNPVTNDFGKYIMQITMLFSYRQKLMRVKKQIICTLASKSTVYCLNHFSFIYSVNYIARRKVCYFVIYSSKIVIT